MDLSSSFPKKPVYIPQPERSGMKTIGIPISDVSKNLCVKIKVTGAKKFKAQMFILRWILTIFGWFVPFAIEIKNRSKIL